MFQGKRALVTGGGRGIGRDIAQALEKDGAETFVLTKSTSSVESLRLEDPNIRVIQVDLSDWENTRKAVESVLPIDLLVNNAAVVREGSFLKATESAIDEVHAIVFKAAFNVSQVVARDLVARKISGAIVNISSVATMRHLPLYSVNGTSKAALDSLTKYMAFELGRKQIRVNAVNPSWVDAGITLSKPLPDDVKKNMVSQIPLRRSAKAREVTNVVLFLLSDRSSFINGVTLPIDGGHKL